MRPDLKTIDFYLVTDTGLSRNGTIHDVRVAVDAGCRIVQYREKMKDTRAMVEEARELRDICRGKALFLVNDRIDVALAVDADGVHIGQDDMPFGDARRILGPDKIIGLTTHDVAESLDAEKAGADYIGLSPIFPTGTKEDAGEACGVDMVSKVRETCGLPIVTIGGISIDNVADVIQAGADSAVAISAVVCADDVGERVRTFIRTIRDAAAQR